MICERCRYKGECGLHEKIQKISTTVEYMLTDDENYATRIFEAIDSLSKCDEFDEEVSISKKEYRELLEIKAKYESGERK